MSIELNMKSVESAVVNDIADHLLNEDRLRDRVDKELTERLDNFFAVKAEEQLEAIVSQAVDEAFDRTYQPVDGFGRPEGEPSSIRKRLEKLTGDYWSQNVDSNGRPTNSSYNKMTRAEYVMVQACGEDFAKIAKQEAVNVAGKMKDGLRAELRKWLDNTLDGLFKVNSADDQARKNSR